MQQPGPRDYHLSEVNQTDKDKCITAVWDLKCGTNELIYETETDPQTEQPCGCPGRGADWGSGISRCKLTQNMDKGGGPTI